MRVLILTLLLAASAQAGEITAYWTAPADDCSDTVGGATYYEVILTQDSVVRNIVVGSDLGGGFCGTGSGVWRIAIDSALAQVGATAQWRATYDTTFIAPAVYGTAEMYTFTGLDNGTYYLLMRPIDEAWNHGPWAVRAFDIDDIEPAPIIILK